MTNITEARLSKMLADAVRYIEYQNAYNGSMNVAQIEAAVADFRQRVSYVEIAHSGPALASFDIAGARDLLVAVGRVVA